MLMTNECIISLFENSTLLVYSNTHVSIFASWFRFSFTSSLSVEITSKIYNFFFIVFQEISEFLFESAVTIAALDAPLLRCFRIRAYEWKLYCVFVCVLFVRMKLQNLLCDHCLRSRYNQTTPSVLLSSCMNEWRAHGALAHSFRTSTDRSSNNVNGETKAERQSRRARQSKEARMRCCSWNDILVSEFSFCKSGNVDSSTNFFVAYI